ncbi:MAG: flagellar motor protein PomA [Gammaproteobacteria bacterium]|nr:flagellar motor protein PomA [Gammaproteobacteria bacterium]
MDIATLVGIVGAFVIIAASIFLGGSVPIFFNMPSILIVVGGTVAVVLCRVSLKQFLSSVKIGLQAFFHKTPPPETLIEEAVALANVARKEGILALEDKEVGHPFLRTGIDLCIDGHPPEVVQEMLAKDINLTLERQNTGAKMFLAVGDAAPAMGMIGTLIGLVQMLSNMDDPKKIGPAMAVALLTTLYGAVIANVVAIPIADKLKLIYNNDRLNKLLILESVSAIQEGTNPRVLEQILLAFLPEDRRKDAAKKKDK